MLIFREFCKTESDQNIHQNAQQTAPHFQKFLRTASIYAPELPSICVQLYN